MSVPRGHICVLCETDCDRATYLRRRVRELENEVLLLSYALVEARDFRDLIREAVERRFPAEEKGA